MECFKEDQLLCNQNLIISCSLIGGVKMYLRGVCHIEIDNELLLCNIDSTIINYVN